MGSNFCMKEEPRYAAFVMRARERQRENPERFMTSYTAKF